MEGGSMNENQKTVLKRELRMLAIRTKKQSDELK